jgi:hypothetical protein
MNREGAPIKPMVGKTFGRLTVVGEGKIVEYGKQKSKHRFYICECSCGNEDKVEVDGIYLRNGKIQSCGCFNKELMRTVGTYAAEAAKKAFNKAQKEFWVNYRKKGANSKWYNSIRKQN